MGRTSSSSLTTSLAVTASGSRRTASPRSTTASCLRLETWGEPRWACYPRGKRVISLWFASCRLSREPLHYRSIPCSQESEHGSFARGFPSFTQCDVLFWCARASDGIWKLWIDAIRRCGQFSLYPEHGRPIISVGPARWTASEQYGVLMFLLGTMIPVHAMIRPIDPVLWNIYPKVWIRGETARGEMPGVCWVSCGFS